jgi:hypothetical protein
MLRAEGVLFLFVSLGLPSSLSSPSVSPWWWVVAVGNSCKVEQVVTEQPAVISRSLGDTRHTTVLFAHI